MPKLPSVTPRVIIKFIRAQGFQLDHSTGSHFVFYHPLTKRRTTIPRHPKDLPKGTLFSILREAGFRREDLLQFLTK